VLQKIACESDIYGIVGKKIQALCGGQTEYRARWKELRRIRIDVHGIDLCRGNVPAELSHGRSDVEDNIAQLRVSLEKKGAWDAPDLVFAPTLQLGEPIAVETLQTYHRRLALLPGYSQCPA
jgi:hypothetical protein